MKQDKRPAGAAVKTRRFFNRISRKLMLFVVLMSMVLLALVWLLSVKLLEPMYNRRVLADLNHAADVYSAIIEKYGKFESFDKSGGVHIPSDMMEEIMDNRGLLAGKCFEVAGTDCKVLLHLHQLQSDQCLLHPNPLSQLMEYSEPQWNSTAAVNLRATTFVLGDLNFTLPDSRILPGLESTSGTRQMVVCRNINTQYSLILSTDLERVGQAADVISAQMPIIAAVLLIAYLCFTMATASPDDSGLMRSISLTYGRDGELTGSAGPYPGSYYSVPLIAVTVLLLALTCCALWRIAHTPSVPDERYAHADRLWRVALTRFTVFLSVGSMLAYAVAVLLVAGSAVVRVGTNGGTWPASYADDVYPTLGWAQIVVGDVLAIAALAFLVMAVMSAVRLWMAPKRLETFGGRS